MPKINAIIVTTYNNKPENNQYIRSDSQNHLSLTKKTISDDNLRTDSSEEGVNAVKQPTSAVELIKKQIAETQHQLATRKAELSKTERMNMPEEEKAQRTIEIQNQISVCAGNLHALQATLIQMTLSVDTHA
ncbi:hypothetical protein LOY52_08600 [Pseudomonas sp. B21-051]|uniref:hypothetical protein n=1 Tax=Pseudomonas sp. B21-051 TaxID=2895491 RepID=UPI002160DE65|nr:hypothetical protein [Pseudomonas sp. B21-051]UVK90119.1 hypothetical protein LOY52_08600 [Pseudomonas sp. B21-051]